jgi:spore germination protein YaaH
VSALAALCATAVVATPQAEAGPRRIVSGWIPYWTTAASVQSLQANADLFSDVSPFWHSSTSETAVTDQETSADRGTVIAAARAAGIPVVPAVTDGTGAGYMAAVMADPGRRAVLVGTLVNLVMGRGYDGIDLDYEGFAFRDGKASWPATRPNWVQFVAQLGAELRARGKLLFATIPPTYDSAQAAGSGYWVYDYAGIAPHVNRVRIMAYDYSVSAAGPIAPYDWVKRIAAYAVTQVPSGKVVLGVPTYGRDWVTATAGTCPPSADLARRSYTATQAWQAAAARGAPVAWDAALRERTFTYAESFADGATACTVTRRAYFSDAQAVIERARLVDTYLLGGVAFWTVGGEDAGQWNLLRILAADPWDPRVAPVEQVQAFVAQVYRDVLGREADPGGLQGWVAALRAGQVSRSGLVRAFEYSPEGMSRRAAALYSEILGRGPDPGGLANWTAALSSGSVRVMDARAGFWASPERVARSGSLQQWVRDMYAGVLGREPDPGGLAGWTQAAATAGPGAVAGGIVWSLESRQRLVAAAYVQFLKRGPDPGGLAGWSAFLGSSDLPVLDAALGGSDEYYLRAQPR